MAIRLNDISTYELIMCAKVKKEFDLVHKEIYEWLIANQVDNYQKLESLLFSERNGLSNIAREQLSRYYEMIVNRMNKANEEEKQPEIFTFTSYDVLDIERATLDYTDNHTRGGILLFGSPINKSGFSILRRLDELSIAEIKSLLGGLSSTDFKNGLTYIKGLKSYDCPRIAKLVEFYEQQVIRQYFETDKREINLFELNREAKRQIVREKIVRIIEYIVEETGEECILGSIGINQKKKLIFSIRPSSRGDANKDILKLLIDRIADYTTLGELEIGILKKQEVVTVVGGKIERVKKKPVDRFIVSKNTSQ